MHSRFRRIVAIAGLLVAGGFVMAGPGTSCTSFSGETAITSLDTSFVFDCQNAFGGTFVFESFLVDCTPDEFGP